MYFYCFLIIFFSACRSASKKDKSSPEAAFPLAAYVNSLDLLDRMKPKGIILAIANFKVLLPKDDKKIADSGAVLLLQYIRSSLEKMNKEMEEGSGELEEIVYADSATKLSPKQKQLVTELKRNHLYLTSDGEGGIYLEVDYSGIAYAIKSQVSFPVYTYLRFLSREAAEPFAWDAALAIPIKELSDRTLKAEAFSEDSTPQTFRKEALEWHKIYTNAFLFGLDNTLSLNDSGTEIDSLFFAEYEHIIKRYTLTQTAASVRNWLRILETGDSARIANYRNKMQE